MKGGKIKTAPKPTTLGKVL